ncbi:hypothetical protein LEN26_005888 [Aphanomyces euteiches]|nr:hypothetical protein AeMF1_021584 [Aphanomyces euteiches]KAH9137172.1 hypothetical protein LEN26_005888 [Aphanomyces euteiches]KAH9196109.1 hypothetical protein AeNC1_001924 [Aphanomyces euteiches]
MIRTSTQLQRTSQTSTKPRSWAANGSNKVLPSLVDLCVQALVLADGSPMRKVDVLFPRLPEELAQSLLVALAEHGKVTDDRLSAFLSISRRVIQLKGCISIRKSVLRQIPFRCPNLTYLDLSNCVQVSNTVVRDILQGCSSLQQLRLDNCRHITDAAFQPDQSLFYPLRACLSLKVLSLAGCSQITHSLILYLLKAYRSLQELNLSRCKRITNDCIKMLLTSSIHLRLRVLNVSFTDVTDDAFTCLSELREIDLGQCKITDATLVSLAQHCPRLEVVRLRWCSEITDAGILRLASHCSRLRVLDLNNCGLLTDQSIASLSQCPHLEWINLAWCVNITDCGLVDLAKVCRELKEVVLTFCSQLTDVALKALVDNCRHLDRLHLNGCTGMSSAAVKALSSTSVAAVVH